MSDCCYMELRCRVCDAPAFIELGFEVDQELENGIVLMVDEEANYGYIGKMPTNIPYVGQHYSGDGYGLAEYACDGTTYAEVEKAHDFDGFVIAWDELCNDAEQSSLDNIRNFFALKTRAEQALLAPAQASHNQERTT